MNSVTTLNVEWDRPFTVMSSWNDHRYCPRLCPLHWVATLRLDVYDALMAGVYVELRAALAYAFLRKVCFASLDKIYHTYV